MEQETTVALYDRPEMEYPVYKVSFKGIEKYIQRSDLMNSGYNWYEVAKTRIGWDVPRPGDSGWLGSTKQEAIETLIRKYQNTAL